MEPINISFDNMESINISDPPISGGNDSLGVGIELLMNDKKKSSTPTIDVGDLNTLEDELNELTNINTSSLGNTEPLNSFSTEPLQPTMSIPIDEIKLDDLNTDSKLGSATANFVGQGSNNFMKQPTVFPTTNMSDREIRRKKRIMLKKNGRMEGERFNKDVLKLYNGKSF